MQVPRPSYSCGVCDLCECQLCTEPNNGIESTPSLSAKLRPAAATGTPLGPGNYTTTCDSD